MSLTRAMRSRMASTLAIVVVTYLASPASVRAQCVDTNVPICFATSISPPVTTTPPTVTITAPMTLPVCTIPEGGFVKINTFMQVDVAASVTGACDRYIWGTYWDTAQRMLNDVTWSQVAPAQTMPVFFATNGYQSIDTTQWPGAAGGSGARSLFYYPTSQGGTGPGAYQLQFVTRALTNGCNIPTDSTPVTRNLNVVACIPAWTVIGNPGQAEHLPTTTVNIYVPPGDLWDALVGSNNDGPAVQAMNDWNSVLAGTGLNFQITSSDCGSGGNCIDVMSSTVTTDKDTGNMIPWVNGCAQFQPTNVALATGTISGYSRLTLNENYWPSASADRLRRSIAHELGHAVSLDHSVPCSTADSIMSVPSAPTPFQACTDASGMALSPTITDILPVMKSTFGNKIRTVCGS